MDGPEITNGAASAASPAAPAPVSAPPPATSQPSSASTQGQGASPSVPGVGRAETPSQPLPSSAAGAAQAQPQAPLSVRDALRGYGLDLTKQFQDDHGALQHVAALYTQAREQADLARYGQQYLRHAGEFQAWREHQQQQQQQAQAQAQQQSWWKAPEYDPSWTQKLTRDPVTGEIKAIAGADPDLPRKYQAWREHQQGFLDRFAQDPMAAIRPGVEQLALQVAQQVVQHHLGGFQERQVADGFVQENSAWLHARDQGGNLVPGPGGKPALSPLGQRFAAYVQEAEQMGLRGVEAQRRYAMGFTQRDYAVAQMQQQGQQAAQPSQPQAGATDPADQARQRFLQAQQQQRQGGVQAAPGQNAQGGAPVAASQRGLQELLMREMAAAGYQPGQRVIAGTEGG